MNILVVGSAYVFNEGLRELCKLWVRLVKNLDPELDVCIIDSASPFEPGVFLDWPVVPAESTILDDKVRSHKYWIYRFADNVGHLSRGGEDGGGRTYCKAMEIAIAGGFDFLAFIETDLLFLRSIKSICHTMHRNGANVCALPNFQYQFPEFGASFFRVSWLKESKLIERYDWKHSQPWPIPEIRVMNLLKDDLTLLPLYGIRIDNTGITPEQLSQCFPYFPPAWITHAVDFNLYTRAVMLNNIQLG